MSWVKLCDGFHRNPKVLRVGIAARGIYASAISWCADNLTDGFIPDDMVTLLAPGEPTELIAECTTRLCEIRAPFTAGLFDRVEGGYRIHDYLAFNPARKDVLLERKRSADRMRKYRKRSSVTASERTTYERKTPGRDGTGNSTSSSRKGAGKPWRILPASETLTDARLAVGTQLGLTPDVVRREWANFAEHTFRSPKRNVDRTWTNWCEKAAAWQPAPASPVRRERPPTNAGPAVRSAAEIRREQDAEVERKRREFEASPAAGIAQTVLKAVTA